MEDLPTVVTLLIALSVAVERVVEIVKGMIPFLSQTQVDVVKEAHRKAWLHALAVVAGMGIAWLAMPVVNEVLPPGTADANRWVLVPALGLLASGGSGFWNTMLTYVVNLKNLKRAALVEAEASAQKAQAPDIVQPKDAELPL